MVFYLKDTAIKVQNLLKELIARGPGHMVLALSSSHDQHVVAYRKPAWMTSNLPVIWMGKFPKVPRLDEDL